MKNENKKGKSVTNILKRSTGVIIIGVFMITLIGTAAWRTYQSEVEEASRIELKYISSPSLNLIPIIGLRPL